jgi:hypothetical protein
MSFLFKSSKKAPNTALPPATREIRSSDGNSSGSQIPQPLNGMVNGSSKPGSPTPGVQSVNNSLNSLADTQPRTGSVPPAEDRQVMQVRQQETNGARRAESPEQKSLRDQSREAVRSTEPPELAGREPLTMSQQMNQRLPAPARPPPNDASPYPWSQRRLTFTVSHTNPFPRYGPAVNASASKDGSIYLMGGLINGSTVKGDLWLVEAGIGNMTCYPVATTSEGPGPRVGHASLLVGNAFIVFGGDTKMDEGDQLDDTLYLLNTCEWA